LSGKGLSEELEREGKAFDDRILERTAHGHVPDLRLATPCDWFQNNVWRRPYLARLLNMRVIDFCVKHLGPRGSRVLDVGCGPGFMSLELARNGYHVTGLDVSAGALELGRRLARENPFKERWGSVEYLREDFLDWTPSGQLFDGVCFFGALHHFPNPAAALDHALTLLVPRGVLVAYEPARDWWTDADATLMALLRTLLSATGAWFEEIEMPRDRESVATLVAGTSAEVREARAQGEQVQSPRDNSAYGTEMLAALRLRLDEIGFAPDTLLFDRIAGGIRIESEQRAEQLAESLQAFELFAQEVGLVRPGGFMFAGRMKHQS
jgi:2-polyprenyl-3-methyl-5-hydroxy-6-metoxy-1,4-benzoquinol methylase